MTTTHSDTFKLALTHALIQWDIPLTDNQLNLMFRHYQSVVETNRAFNLTRITGPVESAIKHYVDSLVLLRWAGDRVSRKLRCLDIGTGAGFPAIPIAIAAPNWKVTAIDSTQKKINFVSKTAVSLQLNNLHAKHARSEHWTSEIKFNLVVARAVSSAANCIIKAAQHVQRGGALVLYKTASIEKKEIQDAQDVATLHKLTPQETFTYTLSCKNETLERVLLIYTRQ